WGKGGKTKACPTFPAGAEDDQASPHYPEPPRAADHGHHLPARSGHRGGGDGEPPRPAELFGRPGHVAIARGEGPFAPRAGRPALRLQTHARPRPCEEVGAQTDVADLLRRLDRTGRRHSARRVALENLTGRTGQAFTADRGSQKGRKVNMSRLSPQSIALVQLLLDAFIKSAIILSVAGLGARSLRRASAASRHLVWSLAMASLLALPVLSIALPSWRIAALPSLSTAASVDASFENGPREPAGFGAIAEGPAPGRGHEPEAGSLAQRQPLNVGAESPASNPVLPRFDAAPNPVGPSLNGFDWKVALLLAWIAGAFAVMARLVAGTARGLLFTRRGGGGGKLWGLFVRGLGSRLRLRRRVRLFKTERISMPMTWGLTRSTVLLPKEANNWSMECRWIVMAHELTHIKRRDCLMQALAQLACAVYWFNPLVWFAA